MTLGQSCLGLSCPVYLSVQCLDSGPGVIETVVSALRQWSQRTVMADSGPSAVLAS